MPVGQKDLGAGRKIFMVLLLALVCGFVWAMIDKKLSPGDLLKVFSGPDKKESSGPPTADSDTKNTPPPKEEKKKEEKKKEEKKEEEKKADPPPSANYSDKEMTTLFENVDLLLRDGKFPDARDRLAAMNKMRVPTPLVTKFSELQDRMTNYCRLLLETSRGGLIEPLLLTRLTLKSTRSYIYAKSPTSTQARWYFEDIRGIRSSLSKEEVDEVKVLNKVESESAVWQEVKRQAGYRGITADRLLQGTRLVYKYGDNPNRTPTGLHFFDLADFCAKNGVNGPLNSLFDEAFRRDPNIIQTVHEVKGERMVDVFLYFLSINSKADAEFTLKQILVPRYSDTRKYREKVLHDDETKTAIAIVTKKQVEEKDLEKKPTDTHDGSGGSEAAPKNPPDERPAEPADSSSSDPGDASKPTPLPPDAPAKARDLVAQGDKLFLEGHKHLMDSSPNKNPTGWSDENHKAQKCFEDAFNNYYYPAQDVFEKAGMKSPQSLNDRVLETQMRRAMCRKRSVSNK